MPLSPKGGSLSLSSHLRPKGDHNPSWQWGVRGSTQDFQIQKSSGDGQPLSTCVTSP